MFEGPELKAQTSKVVHLRYPKGGISQCSCFIQTPKSTDSKVPYHLLRYMI